MTSKLRDFPRELREAFARVVCRLLISALTIFIIAAVAAGEMIAFIPEVISPWLGWSLVTAVGLGFWLGFRSLRGLPRRLMAAGLVTIVACSGLQVWLLDGLFGSLFSSLDYSETVYSEGYSDTAFRIVYPGMSESVLLRILKMPLREVWIYRDPEEKTISFSHDRVEDVSCVSGENCTAARERLPVGAKKEDVISFLGEPTLKSFVYSRSRYSDSHRVRVIQLSRGVVVEKEAYYYSD